MADLRAALAGLSEVVNKLNSNSHVSRRNKESLTAAETSIKAQIAALSNDVTAKDQAIAATELELEKFKRQVKKLLQKGTGNDNGDDDQDDNEADEEDDATFMVTDVNEYNNLTAKADRLQKENDTLAVGKKNWMKAMHAKGAENRGLHTDISKGKTNLASSKEALKNKGFEHQAELDEKNEKLQGKIAEIGRLNHSAKVQDARILGLNSDLHKSKGDLTGIRDTLAKRDREIRYWRDQLPAKEREVERLQKEAKKLEDDHKVTVDDLEERRTKLVAEKGRLAEESEETIGAIKTELDKVKGEKGKLEEELKKAKEDLEESESTNAMLWKRVAKYEGAGAGAGAGADGESPASKRARTEGS